MVPFVKRIRPDLMWHWLGSIPHLGVLAFLPFVFFVILVIVGSSNAVNLDRWAGRPGDRLHDHCRQEPSLF